jgi:hypothetical protein
MDESSNDIAVALLATLEARAQKKGKRSIAKAVAAYLGKAGASKPVIRQVKALQERNIASMKKANGQKPHLGKPSKAKPAIGPVAG